MSPHAYSSGYMRAVAEQAEAKRLEDERRARLEADTTTDTLSPYAPLSPRAAEAFRNLGILDD